MAAAVAKEPLPDAVMAEQCTAAALRQACLDWQGHLFGPAKVAGLLPLDSLAAYRHSPANICGSRYVSPPHEKLMGTMDPMDPMDPLFASLRQEQDPWKRAVLRHYVFVNIHPSRMATDASGDC